ncbi:uracil-DNA glycosylase [Shewanella sp. C32]|uniref:Uracil-DNA glycosylase n=1 Tax=Shewanella electrica TaxID=515560 RepID=A0ABT2FJW2_9GAMM|nr:uracil-DNA glycosylase [Shewanella electrica]MCH1923417.1 uracil-DNA glycosylase [Shewanella electrica]MCS4555514.1 uracil-DNA glycosylase [Shewanella electrica]
MTTELTWKNLLNEERNQPYFRQILHTVNELRASGKTIYPAQADTFNAFKLTPFERLKVVIIGQDPYHGAHQAHGLSFSVPFNVNPPPSLQNIFLELQHTVSGFNVPNHGNLTRWAEQGVLLLNTVLTVEAGKAHSHADLGWERFTDKVIEQIDHYSQGVAFMLWGRHAGEKAAHVNKHKHLVLRAAPPSPFSANKGFFGCNHFNLANAYLRQQGKTPIDWQL